MPKSDNNSKPLQTNSTKLDGLAISLDFLKREVKTLTNDQKEIRLMLLEILENTRPFVLQDKPEPEPEPEPEPVKSWFWSS